MKEVPRRIMRYPSVVRNRVRDTEDECSKVTVFVSFPITCSTRNSNWVRGYPYDTRLQSVLTPGELLTARCPQQNLPFERA